MSASPSSPDDLAIDWLVRLHSGHADARLQADYQAWRGASAEHRRAADEAEALWQLLGQTGHAQRPQEPPRPAPPARRHRRGAAPGTARWTQRFRRGWRVAASTAALALVLVVSVGHFGPIARLYADQATAAGERRRIDLPDGSVAWLNTATAVSLDYAQGRRRIVLHAGEATFQVRKDPAHPFVVVAGGHRVRALGTRFTVRERTGRDAVSIDEGVIEVSRAGQRLQLVAGQRVAVDAAGRLGPVQPLDAADTAWRRGKLLFNRRPLAEVAAELQRYRRGRLLVVGTRLRELQVSGVFALDDQQGALRSLEQTLPVRVLSLPGLTLLVPKDLPQKG